ncbi:hypothetical protein XI01_14095 [Bradyrhizobium sp. CCBAU 21360]|nr:hypothetical protein [Bradyrhizobium sp. CCBAU 21360]
MRGTFAARTNSIEHLSAVAILFRSEFIPDRAIESYSDADVTMYVRTVVGPMVPTDANVFTSQLTARS